MPDILPHILQDRCNIASLEHEHPDLIRKLRDSKIGSLSGGASIQFCGLAWVDHVTAFVFVPRQSLRNAPQENLEIARLTMRALARFGRDKVDRLGIASGAEGQTGLLATIAELAEDFVRHGIYAERTRHNSRNNGKPLWARTVTRELALLGDDGSVVYPQIHTTRTKDSHNSLLARVQVAIMREISSRHSWWLEGVRSREEELAGYDLPSVPRFLWAGHLKLLLPELYAARAVSLANALISYLDNDRDRQSGEIYFGVDDFHAVWEHMLRQTLSGVEQGWNSRLPRPAYIKRDGNADVQDRGLQTDIVLRDGTGLRIVDAKYYDAFSTSNAPGLSDIIKQFFYDFAVSSVAERVQIGGCFVFPALEDGMGPYTKIQMRHRNNATVAQFPEIECHYLNTVGVLRAFVDGRKIDLPMRHAG